jgi:hypothetical protein
VAIDFSLKGTGFLIWRLKNVLPYDRLVAALRRANATWVSLKLADGPNNYNQVNQDGVVIGNDSFLKVLIQRLQDDGYDVGMWQFIYTKNRYSPGLQAAKASERIAKLGLTHLLVDAEAVGPPVDARWNDPLYKRDAVTYMNQLDISDRFPVGICSYRYPDYFPNFPWNQFVNHENTNWLTQQHYWLGRHDPGAQLIESVRQYNKIRKIDPVDFPLIPIGAAFPWGNWLPDLKDFAEFKETAESLGSVAQGYYALDNAIMYPDWLDAIAGKDPTLPPPDPEPEPTPDPSVPSEVTVKIRDDWKLNLRNEPSDAGGEATVIAKTENGKKFYPTGIKVADYKGRGDWYELGKHIWIAGWLTV